LNVALDLGRERKGNDPAFDQMEQDISVLSEIIGRLLTIARLDRSAPPVPMTPVDLSELVSQIVRDADFESRERDGCVKLTVHGQLFVQGEAELLHSAIENLVATRFATLNPARRSIVLESELSLNTRLHALRPRFDPGVQNQNSSIPFSRSIAWQMLATASQAVRVPA
jgi:two-component system sensor histidine kinase CpxA